MDVSTWGIPPCAAIRANGNTLHLALVAGMSAGAASEAVRRTTGGGGQGSLFMSEANVKRLVGKLSQMRGAALKLGQFMSIQGESMSSAHRS
jgi:predicted unusual protein kinase regulating ubiquinone biosynthesis (AarF/ABC1/UbiB family)